MTLDLLAAGWAIVYAEAVVTHHHPSPRSDARDDGVSWRSRVWIAWLRLPAAAAWRLTQDSLAGADWRCALSALAGLPWAPLRRRVVPEEVQRMLEAAHEPRAALAKPTQSTRAA